MSDIIITSLAVTRKMRNGRENTGSPSVPISGGSTGSSIVYSHTGTTVRDVGGILTGTDLNGLTIEQIIDRLFY